MNKSNIDEVIGAMPPLSIATLMGGEDNIRRFESEVENLWGKAEDGELIKIGKGFLLREADIERHSWNSTLCRM